MVRAQQANSPLGNVPVANRELQKMLEVGLIISGALILGLVGFLLSQRQPPTNTATARAQVLSTPQDFDNFIGRVRSVQGARLVVTLRLADRSGQQIPKNYHVRIDAATQLQQMSTQSQIFSDIDLSDIHPGDTVQVFGTGNLFPVSSFTATALWRLANP